MKAEHDTQQARRSPQCRQREIGEDQSHATRLLASVRADVRARYLNGIGLADLDDPQRPWLLGFSHGPDSTLLLEALAGLCREAGSPELVAIHIDHATRAESADEARLARAHCHSLNIVCRNFRLTETGGETRLRTLRYEKFRELAAELDASALFLAQQQDDDLETLIFRLMRGSGPTGLACIPRERRLGARTWVLRPLLDYRRSEIERAIKELGLPCLHDPSNLDPAHSPRNSIRHLVLPALRQRDPQDRGLLALLREAKLLAASVARELAAHAVPKTGSQSFTVSLTSTKQLSPWGLEEYWVRILTAMGQRRPGRALLRFLRQLHSESCAGRKRVESRGHWYAQRLRGRIEVHSGSFAQSHGPG